MHPRTTASGIKRPNASATSPAGRVRPREANRSSGAGRRRAWLQGQGLASVPTKPSRGREVPNSHPQCGRASFRSRGLPPGFVLKHRLRSHTCSPSGDPQYCRRSCYRPHWRALGLPRCPPTPPRQAAFAVPWLSSCDPALPHRRPPCFGCPLTWTSEHYSLQALSSPLSVVVQLKN